nr:HNH endonuclease [Jatrophihabitans sp. GAS493]
MLDRDGRICGYCRSPQGLTIDHIRPRAQGGKNGWLNTVACCAPCNGRKRDRTPEQAGMKLLVTPYAPRRRR